jgi:tetratricopeptide (TPR) repeat protein
MIKRTICMAAIMLTACSEPAPAPEADSQQPAPQASAEQQPAPLADPQQIERRCHDYTVPATEQADACTTLIGLYGDATANRSFLALAYLARGTAHVHMGDATRAEPDYREAIRLDSIPIDGGQKEVPLYNDRCWARAVAKIDLDAALADCNEALKLRPDFVPALDSRAFVHMRGDRFREAMADYDAAIKGSPQNPWSLYGRGIAKLRLGDTAGAQADIAASKAVQDVASEFAAYGFIP